MSKSRKRGENQEKFRNVTIDEHIFLEKIRKELKTLASTIQLDPVCIGKNGKCAEDQMILLNLLPDILCLLQDAEKHGYRDPIQEKLIKILYEKVCNERLFHRGVGHDPFCEFCDGEKKQSPLMANQ